jgi:hypothetical protein
MSCARFRLVPGPATLSVWRMDAEPRRLMLVRALGRDTPDADEVASRARVDRAAVLVGPIKPLGEHGLRLRLRRAVAGCPRCSRPVSACEPWKLASHRQTVPAGRTHPATRQGDFRTASTSRGEPSAGTPGTVAFRFRPPEPERQSSRSATAASSHTAASATIEAEPRTSAAARWPLLVRSGHLSRCQPGPQTAELDRGTHDDYAGSAYTRQHGCRSRTGDDVRLASRHLQVAPHRRPGRRRRGRPERPALLLARVCGPAPEACPGPRIHLPRGFLAKFGRALVLAISASLHLVDLLVLGVDVAEDLQFRGSRGGQASDWPRCAPCFAVI